MIGNNTTRSGETVLSAENRELIARRWATVYNATDLAHHAMLAEDPDLFKPDLAAPLTPIVEQPTPIATRMPAEPAIMGAEIINLAAQSEQAEQQAWTENLDLIREQVKAA